MKELHS